MVVGEFTQEANLVIIGGGPAGYTAAFRAAELGLNPVIVEAAAELGGVCLRDGCIPSKALLHIAETINLARRAESFGVSYPQPTIDIDRVRAWVSESVSKLAGGLRSLAKKHKVEVINGVAKFEDSRRLAVRESTVPRIRFRYAVIATGAQPTMPFDAPKDERIMTPQQAVHVPMLPASLLVVGSNTQAVELASIYAALGSKVTLMDSADQLLPDADGDLLRPLVQKLKDRMSLRLGATVREVKADDHISVVISEAGADKAEHFDSLIVAGTPRPNSAHLNLTATCIALDDTGAVSVNEQLRTAESRIFAIGDVTGPPFWANKAMHQATVCAEVLAGHNSAFDVRTVPVMLFTDPQVAWCGMTESQLKEQGYRYKVQRLPWGASGRAVGMNRADGVTKLLYDPETKLIHGVGITGPHATEMIAEGALAIELGATLTDLAATLHPHPSLSELVSDAARTAEQMIDDQLADNA